MNKLQMFKNVLLSSLELKKVQLKKELKVEYLKFEEMAATKILPIINSFIRDLIVSKGKNPDYVASKREPNLKDVVSYTAPSIKFNEAVPNWVRPSFKDKTKHPIYKSRMSLHIPKNAAPVEVVTVVDLNPVDKLQSLFNIITAEDQAALKAIDKPEPVKPIKVKSKKKPVKVKRTKKGSFRRVEE